MNEIKDTREIFDQESGDRPATPYFLVYVKDESKEDLVNSLCRDVIEPPLEVQQDTLMEDYSQAQESQTDGSTYKPVNSSTEYSTVDSYNGRGWTHDDGWVETNTSGAWNQKEASVYSGW